MSGTAQGYQASMFYMISYVIVACGAFGMILLLARQGFEADKIVDFHGLNARSPWFAGMMAILMFSLAGLPPFIGFWAKLGVIQAVLGVSYTWLAVVAVLFSVVGAFFYLRIVKLMYFDEPTETTTIGGSAAHADGTQRQCSTGVWARRRPGNPATAVSASSAIVRALGETGKGREDCTSAARSDGPLAMADAPGTMRGSSGAGWSSLAARRAHNPKVVGSNPTPATNSHVTR